MWLYERIIIKILELFQGKQKFYPLELLAVEEVKQRLNANASGLLQQQIDSINKIYRLSSGKEVLLYRMVERNSSSEDNMRFANQSDEILLAHVTFSLSRNEKALKLEFWLTRGILFSFIYDAPPAKFFAINKAGSMNIYISEVKIWIDPMKKGLSTSNKIANPSEYSGAMRDWNKAGLIKMAGAPLEQAERDVCFSRVDAQMPADFIEILTQANGVKMPGCVINGAENIRKIVGSDENYYILAEFENIGVLVVKDGGVDSSLYLLPYEDDAPTPLGTSFREAVNSLIRGA